MRITFEGVSCLRLDPSPYEYSCIIIHIHSTTQQVATADVHYVLRCYMHIFKHIVSFKQFEHSDKDQVTLKSVDFEASGFYYCEVSTDTPIFTKESKDEPMVVIRRFLIRII